MPKIDSSAISHVGYQDQRRLLYVIYAVQVAAMSMSTCRGAIMTNMLKAKSKGAFVNERIKPHYKCQRLGDA